MMTAASGARRNAPIAVLLALGCWALLATMSLGQTMLALGDHGETMRRGDVLFWAIDWSTCALFTPVLFAVARRAPIDRDHWRRNVPLELGVVAGCVALKDVLLVALFRSLVPTSTLSVRRLFLGNTVAVVTVFLGVIAVAHAIAFARAAVERERTASRLRAQLSTAQLETLKGQLQPHFLFNTLNGIATLMHRDVGAADQMLTQLAALLRVTLQVPGSQEIPLAEELALLDRYLSIVRTRFGDRLTIVRDIADGLGDALVPHFVLQPLVENALEHGIARRPGPGRLAIAAARDGDRLRITIADDGLGLSDTPLNGGVGLANTRSRLEQLYGDAQTLRLEDVAPAGARATITLPFRVRT